MSSDGLDRIYELPYMRMPHPCYRDSIPAFEMIKDSITVVRGCCGGCSFCGLGFHQGRFLSSRSEKSVERETNTLAATPSFRGTISDLGGPTANLYGCRNGIHPACTTCRRVSCLYPEICPHLKLDPDAAIKMMHRVSAVPSVKHVFIQSGIRMDLALKNPRYIRELARNHTSGHLKVAPEHMHPSVLRRMRKSGPHVFNQFREMFEKESAAAKREQYLVPYFISNFPGSTAAEMKTVENFLRKEHWKLQQVQDFIPLPMTPAAAMYYTGLDYESEKPMQVVKGLAARRPQVSQLRTKTPRPPQKQKKPFRRKRK